jgi:hypothetical protein
MCCGQKRAALRNNASTGTTPSARKDHEMTGAATPLNLFYLRNVPNRLRVSVTGRQNDSSRSRPVQAGDFRDGAGILRNRFFRQT